MKNQFVRSAIYGLGGLRIKSDFPLIGLHNCRDEANYDVVIRRVAIPEEIASTIATFRNGKLTGKYNGKEVLLDFPSVGRFLVRAGDEILLDAAPSSDSGEVRAYLLGTVFGVLCYQRGITPLHASAINVTDGCVAFVGASGAGKSTLVGALARRGHEIISDDVCFIQLDDKGNVQTQPGIGRIRLWEDAMRALDYERPGIEREMHGFNKYFISVRSRRSPLERRRLRRVYELHTAPNSAIEVSRLRGARAIEVLVQNVYRLGHAEYLGYKPKAFTVCAAAARNVDVFRLSRPKHFDALEETIKIVEDHLREIA